MRYLFVLLALLLFPTISQAQQFNVTVPITIPPPSPINFNVPAGTKVTSPNGLVYLVTGLITLTPVTTTAELPPADLPVETVYPDGPFVAKTDWTAPLLSLIGHGFGDQPGSLMLDFHPASFTFWSDALITAQADQRPSSYTIDRPDHNYLNAMLWPIAVAPRPGPEPPPMPFPPSDPTVDPPANGG